MKFSLLSVLVAGATLAQVGASPLRVVVVTSNQDNVPKLRFGHAAAHHNNEVAKLVRPQASADSGMKGPCRGARLRQKAVELSNAFRQALGFGPSKQPEVEHGDGMVHILPFVGTPSTFIDRVPAAPPIRHTGGGKIIFVPHAHPHHRPDHPRRIDRLPFMKRLHFALMSLGPWEGRAVAFVLGCGIGVLLRMLWVLSVISYRMIRGTKEDENKYTEIIVVEDFGDDAEELFVAPPNYTYPDEKADKPAVQATEVAK